MTNSEQEIYQFWQEKAIFETAAANTKRQTPYVFWDIPFSTLATPGITEIGTFLARDTIAKTQQNLGNSSVLRWGWNSHNPSIETFTASHYLEASGQELQDKCLEISSSANSQWQELVKSLGCLVDSNNQYDTGDREYIESVWWGLGQLWQKNLLKSQHQVSLYSPSKKTSLSHHQAAVEVVWKEENVITPIVRFKVLSDSAKALLRKIEEEINFQYTDQIKVKNDIERRLLQIKEISSLGRKSNRSNIFNSGDNPSFQGIDWENFRTDQEVAVEVYSLREKLETILENVDTLARLKLILTRSCPLSLLTWVVNPWSLPANSCVAVNPNAEYSMYFLEASGELVILAEERSIPVLSLQLHDAVVNSPEIEEELDGITDGGEYFEKLGVRIIKVVSFSGNDLEGLEYSPLFENGQELDTETSSNLYRIYTSETVKSQEGTGIIHIAPAYGKFDFQLSAQYNLPIINCLDENGILMANLDFQLDIAAGQSFEVIGDIITGILDKKRLVFASIKWQHRTPILKSDATGLYYLVRQNWYFGQPSLIDKATENLNDIQFDQPNHKQQINQQIQLTNDLAITTNNTWGTPLPIWEGQDKSQLILIDSMAKLQKYAVNPIYQILNTKDLVPGLYLEGKIAIVTDNMGRLPLGINAVQYRSKAFSAMRRERNITADKFNPLAQELLSEIVVLFERYKSVQILFTESEQIMWTSFLTKDESSGNHVSSVFYFYKPLVWDSDNDNYQVQPEIEYLDLRQASLNQIILKDEIGNFYKRQDFSLDNWVDIASSSWAALEYPSPSMNNFGPRIAVDTALNLTSSLYTGHLLSTAVMDNRAFWTTKIQGRISMPSEFSIIDGLEEYSSDSLRFYLAKKGCWQGRDIIFLSQQWRQAFDLIDRRTGNILNYIKVHQGKSKILFSSGNNPKHILNKWLNNKTVELSGEVQGYSQEHNFQKMAVSIEDYLDLICNQYLKLIKYTPAVNMAENLSCLRRNLLILATISRALIPFVAERIWLSLATSDMHSSVHLAPSLSLPELLPKQTAINDRVENLLSLINAINKVRGRSGIPLSQPLRGEIKNLDLESSLGELLIQACALVPQDMTNLEGQIAEIEGVFGKMKLDMVVDRSLQVLSRIRQFERQVQKLRSRYNFQYGEVISMKWQLENIADEELIGEVIAGVNWTRLYVDIKWVQNLEEAAEIGFEIPGFVKVLVQ